MEEENRQETHSPEDTEERENLSLARGCLVNSVLTVCIMAGIFLAYRGAFGDLDGIYFPIGLGMLGVSSAVMWKEWK